ncbi:MAG: LamG domain-containing protein, partial [Candidatus Aenigmarchaeota archaeon]|nr:LamG domain-containing protein [Candidatus Aenigmarchaeota archaeon]
MDKKQIKILTIFFAFLFITPIYASDPHLVAEWQFDEGSGSVLHDSSGNGNDGTIHGGATWTEGIKGNALSFDGIDDYVKIPYTSILNITQEITIESSIRLKTNTSYGFILSKRNSEYGIMPYELIYHKKLNGFQFQTKNLSEHSWNFAIDKEPPFVDVWYHIVGVFNGSDMILYVNNKKTVGTSVNSLSTNTAYLAIGKDGASNNQEYFFHGLIDEVRIYNRALSDEEIKAHYDAIMHPTPAYPNATKNAIILIAGNEWQDLIQAQSTGRKVIFTDTITDKIKNEIIASKTDQIWILGNIQNKEDLNATQITSRDHIPQIFFNTTQFYYTDKEHAIMAALISAQDKIPLSFILNENTTDLTLFTNENLQKKYIKNITENIDNLIVANTNDPLAFTAPEISRQYHGIPVTINETPTPQNNETQDRTKQKIIETATLLAKKGLYTTNKEHKLRPVYITILGNNSQIPYYITDDTGREILFNTDGNLLKTDLPYADFNSDGKIDAAIGRITNKNQLYTLENINTAKIMGEYRHSKYANLIFLGGGMLQTYTADNILKNTNIKTTRAVETTIEVNSGTLKNIKKILEKLADYAADSAKHSFGGFLKFIKDFADLASMIMSIFFESDWDNWNWQSLEFPPHLENINTTHFTNLSNTEILMFFGVGNKDEITIPKEERSEWELTFSPYRDGTTITSINYNSFFFMDYDESGIMTNTNIPKQLTTAGAYGFASTGIIHDPYSWQFTSAAIEYLKEGNTLGESLYHTTKKNPYDKYMKFLPHKYLGDKLFDLGTKNIQERIILGNPKTQIFDKLPKYTQTTSIKTTTVQTPNTLKLMAQTQTTEFTLQETITNNYEITNKTITTNADEHMMFPGFPLIPVKTIIIYIPQGAVVETIEFEPQYKTFENINVPYMPYDEYYNLNLTTIEEQFPQKTHNYEIYDLLDNTKEVHITTPLIIYSNTTADVLKEAKITVTYTAPLEITSVTAGDTTIGNNATVKTTFESSISETGMLYLYLDNNETVSKEITITQGTNTYEFIIETPQVGRHAIAMVYNGETSIPAKHTNFYVFEPVFEFMPPANKRNKINQPSNFAFKFTVYDQMTGF